MHNRYIKYFLFLLLTTDLFLSALFLKNGHTDTEKIFSLPVISKTAGTPKYIALTFDDGPSRKYTPILLDGLKERGVHATFFLMGKNIEGEEDIVKRMSEEGHLIGNHSYEHIQLTKAGAKAVCEAVEHTQEQIEAITGKRPEYIRPPYGDWNEELEEEIGMTPVLWSLDSLDWKLKDTGKIIRQVLKDVKDGDIILLHDIFPSSVEAALELIDILQKEGYVFVTADELLIEVRKENRRHCAGGICFYRVIFLPGHIRKVQPVMAGGGACQRGNQSDDRSSDLSNNISGNKYIAKRYGEKINGFI